MHNRSFQTESSVSFSSTRKPVGAAASTGTSLDELTRLFSTAILTTRVQKKRNFSAELRELTESPSFRTILSAVRQHAQIQGLTEKQAAEQIIDTFRKIDEIWSEYLVQEGIDRLRKPR
jgi:hypothetical protein